MRHHRLLALLLALGLLGLSACSSSDDSTPSTPTGPGGGDGDGVVGSLTFADYGTAARQVLPPVYESLNLKAIDIWRAGDHALLGKVFGPDEPMSIHRNIDEFDRIMLDIESMLETVAAFEAEHDTLPAGPIPFEDPQYGTGTMHVQLREATGPLAVPAVCQTVFGAAEVTVDWLLHIECVMDGGEDWISPYIGFSASDAAQTVYLWDVNRDETGAANGSVLLLASKDIASDAFEIAGATFKPDGPGDEDRCNWVYHLTGNADYEFTYNMGWYSENPDFQLFGCVQGSGDKDLEFGLRYHQYTDGSGWDVIDDFAGVSEEVFGPVGDDPYASIAEPDRSGTLADYVDATVMYVRDDSPLAEIPNPFAGLFD